MSLPPSEIPLGAIRFNSDSQKLEYWMGSAWMQIQTFSPTLDGGGRGIFFGGRDPNMNDTIDYVTISSAGNAIDFGNMTNTRRAYSAMGDNTRGLAAGGIYNSSGNTTAQIDFVTISSTGDAQDFGDLTEAKAWHAGVNNATRGLIAGKWGVVNVIEFVTIQSEGDAVDFGDLTEAQQTDGSFSSPTRGFWVGGAAGSGPDYNAPTTGTKIECVTTATLGNAFDFGDIINGTYGKVGASNSIRGLAAGGYGSPAHISAIELITLATLGNSSGFGDLTTAFYYGAGTSDTTRGIFGGGDNPINTIEYVNISTEGDSVDFGDLTVARRHNKATSNANGGLG